MGVSIAVIGSLDPGRTYEPPLRDYEIGLRACRELGARLAAEGFGLTVYSSNPRFIEAAIVSGYAESPAARQHAIRVIAPMNASHKQFAEMADRPELFQTVNNPSGDWEVGFYRSLASVAGVLLIGGGRPTYIAGLIALSLRTPVVCLARFGGAAQSAWDSLDRTRNDATDEELRAMAEHWSDDSAPRMVKMFKDQIRRREERVRADQNAAKRATTSLVVTAGLFVLGVVLIPLLFSIDPSASRNIGGLLAASLLAAPVGAVIRNVLGGGEHWLRTAILGMVAGAIACLLFIVAQVATSPGALEGEGARTLLLFVVPISFVAGLTFDAVYNKLTSQDVLDVSPFRDHLKG